ncbi:hypothetical protein HYQ44_009594 [Verticillium longisporum]|nr:hypothetical protein HYQ44_009594 [Verticillium longisporum]
MSRVCITIRFACRDASRHGGSLSQSVQDPFTLHTKLKEQSFGLVACSDDGGTAGQRRGWLLMYLSLSVILVSQTELSLDINGRKVDKLRAVSL